MFCPVMPRQQQFHLVVGYEAVGRYVSFALLLSVRRIIRKGSMLTPLCEFLHRTKLQTDPKLAGCTALYVMLVSQILDPQRSTPRSVTTLDIHSIFSTGLSRVS